MMVAMHSKAATPKGQAKVASLLGMAKCIVIESGFDGLTLRELSRRLGISLSHLQYYFASRDALIEAMFLDVAATYRAERDAILDAPARSPRDRLRAVVAFLLTDCLSADTTRYFIELWAIAQRDERYGRIMGNIYGWARERMAALIGDTDAGISPEECAIRAAWMFALMEGTMPVLARAYFEPDRETFIERTIDHLMEVAIGPVASPDDRQHVSSSR
ncbi:MAG: transcriptional regulator, TetR family [Rhizorhabdus sp.]|nr:transcriptional regulator, TetR family [Rhizorhabdus sp.]